MPKKGRKLTKKEARRMRALVKNPHYGRTPIPTPCPKCDTMCKSRAAARYHCSASMGEIQG